MRLPAFKKLNENLAQFLVNSNLHKRSLTAIILGGMTIYVMLTSNLLTTLLILLIYVGCIIEWFTIVITSSKQLYVKIGWLLSGFIFISIGVFALYNVCQTDSQTLLILCCVIWTSDTGAYIVGNLLKGPKLIPKISPNKTISGSIGGMILSSCAGIILIKYFPEQSRLLTPFLNYNANFYHLLAIVIISQLGDLLESYAKRCFNIRDSSQIIPGHGGLLDRCDSIITVGVYLIIIFSLSNLN